MADIRLTPPEIEDLPRWAIYSMAGGLNQGFPSTILDNQARDLQNMLPYLPPSIETRRGCVRLNVTPIGTNPIWGLYSFDRITGSELLAASGTDIFRWTGTAFVSIRSALTANQRVRFDTWRGATDLCLIVNGREAPLRYDGTTVANLGGSPPTASLVKVHRNRVFLNNVSFPSRFHWSDAGTAEAWAATSWMDVPGRDRIVAFAVWVDSLVIFKEDSVWFLHGTAPANWTLKRGAPTVGATSQESVVNFSSDLLFLSRLGIHRLSGVTTEVTFSFDALRSRELTAHTTTLRDNFTKGLLERACAINFNDWYWLSLGEGAATHHNLVVVIDPFIDPPGIYPLRGWRLSSMCVSRQEGEDRFYGGSSEAIGRVWRLDHGTNDDGVAINAYYKTKYYGAARAFQRMKKIQIITQNSGNYHVNMEQHLDFEAKVATLLPLLVSDGASLWDSMVWDAHNWGGAQDLILRRYLSDAGRYCSFHFFNTNRDQPFALRGFECWSDLQRAR
ncbi:MAG: hypothetical protein DDT19_00241 [Syntrophomonadaceae bacterium]|nr:hypothetical protein [Bacillota bacterium]